MPHEPEGPDRPPERDPGVPAPAAHDAAKELRSPPDEESPEPAEPLPSPDPLEPAGEFLLPWERAPGEPEPAAPVAYYQPLADMYEPRGEEPLFLRRPDETPEERAASRVAAVQLAVALLVCVIA